MKREPKPEKEFWEYTSMIRLQNGGNIYEGRPLIGRDTPIDGGVYYGVYTDGGEAIVVDSQKYPEVYDEWSAMVRERASVNGNLIRDFILSAVYETVLEQMPYSQKGVDSLRKLHRNGDGQKIELSMFMEDHVGVCRHQALAAGVLIERLVKDGTLGGHVSVDRSQESPQGDPQGHAWVRYTNSAGRVYIIDIANKNIGTLQEANAAGDWNYMRPEDRTALQARRLGHTAFPPAS